MPEECVHPDDLAEWQQRRAAVEAADAALRRYAAELGQRYALGPADTLWPDGVISRGAPAAD